MVAGAAAALSGAEAGQATGPCADPAGGVKTVSTEKAMLTPAPAAPRGPVVTSLLLSYGTLLALAALVVVFALASPGFLAVGNLINILRQISLLAIAANGFTLALIVGEFDLGFANVASLAGVLVAGLIFGGHPVALAVAAGLLVGVVFGLFNGLVTTRLGVNSLITTLASGSIALGLGFLYTRGVAFYGAMPASFTFLGRGTILGVPALVLAMILIVGGSHAFIAYTRPGRYILAVGGNPQAARLAGIRVNFYRTLGLCFASLSGAITGILLTARLSSAHPTSAAEFLMDGIAASLLGMTLQAGRPNVLGTFVGALIIGVLNNGLTLLGTPYYVNDIAKGFIIILSVTMASIQAMRRAG